jgi:hypothetical protein
MLPVAGATVWLWDLFFLRRMKKNMAKPMSARPTRGPTTAPAIQALLVLFPPPPPFVAEMTDGLDLGELVGVTEAEIRLGTGSARREVSGDTRSPGQQSGYGIFDRTFLPAEDAVASGGA